MYYHDWPLSAFVKYVDDNWATFEGGQVYQFGGNFAEDAASDLPTYCFIEPRYTDYFGRLTAIATTPGDRRYTRSRRPSASVMASACSKMFYSILYRAPGNLFAKTLLIVLYDEHGCGLYDHISPATRHLPIPARIRDRL